MAVSWLRDAPAAQPLALYLVSAFGSGVCIGATGIGGVLLVPLLLLMGVPIGVASPAVIASLLPAGVVALIANRRIVPRIETATAGLSAVPGAVAGSLLFPLVPAALISSSAACALCCASNALNCAKANIHISRQVLASLASLPKPIQVM